MIVSLVESKIEHGKQSVIQCPYNHVLNCEEAKQDLSIQEPSSSSVQIALFSLLAQSLGFSLYFLNPDSGNSILPDKGPLSSLIPFTLTVLAQHAFQRPPQKMVSPTRPQIQQE